MKASPVNILLVNASARPHRSDQQERGSHSRQLTGYFLDKWLGTRPGDSIIERDVGLNPPSAVTFNWLRGAFSDPTDHDEVVRAAMANSNTLARELVEADVVVIGSPIYNFGMPAQLKAWIDNVVRIGITFSVSAEGVAAPMLSPDKYLVLLTARGDKELEGDSHGGPDLVIAGLRRPMAYLGIEKFEIVSIDGGLFHDEHMHRSFAAARARIDDLVREIQESFVPKINKGGEAYG